MRGVTLLLALAVPAAALAADLTAAQLFASGRVMDHESVIVATPRPHDADMCRGFSLTGSQVKSFFHRATLMTADAVHRLYQWSPCEVEGHILYRDQKFLFLINAAATGKIEVAPGRYLSFGCANCQDMFDYGYLMPATVTAAAPAAASAPPQRPQ